MWDWGNRQMNQAVLLHLDQVEIGGSVIINAIDIDGAIGMAHCKLGAGVTIAGTLRGGRQTATAWRLTPAAPTFTATSTSTAR